MAPFGPVFCWWSALRLYPDNPGLPRISSWCLVPNVYVLEKDDWESEYSHPSSCCSKNVVSPQGAFCGILCGHGIGVVRMALEFVYPVPSCGETDTRPLVLSAVHYTYFSQMNMLLTALIVVVVSLLTEPVSSEEVCKMKWRWILIVSYMYVTVAVCYLVDKTETNICCWRQRKC